MRSITPTELAKKQAQSDNIVIIDVRTPMEYQEVHIPHAVNLPLDQVTATAVSALATELPVYIICKSGQRASNACEKLADNPELDVELVEGGTDGWVAAGLNVVRGEKSMSLERQVRLTAGLIVLGGSILAYTVDTTWLLVPAIMGAGLAFAAITNSCVMGMMLARMPWNHRRGHH